MCSRIGENMHDQPILMLDINTVNSKISSIKTKVKACY